MTDENTEKPSQPIDKAAVDATEEGSWIIFSERPHIVSPDNFSIAVDRMLDRMVEHGTYLDLRSLRHILLTSELPDRVKEWQRQLRRPETGVSQQTEGIVAGKILSWGFNSDSARTIIILDDALAAAAVMDMPAAVSTVAHEFGHASDYHQRHLLYGFSELESPVMTDDWPNICREAADSIWSEYAAESVACRFMTEQELTEFRANDALHLVGIDARIRQSVLQFKTGQITLGTLWNNSITNVFDLLTNLGRAAARVPVEESVDAVSTRLAGTDEAAGWVSVIEKLLGELRTLRTKQYDNWSHEPFAGIEDAVELGFHSVGLIPSYNGNGLRLRVV